MSLREELKKQVRDFYNTVWTTRAGRKVPEAQDVKYGNDAVELDGTVLYADIAKSTALVDGYKHWFSANVYKSYLHCAAKIIKHNGGAITSYDGDRIMAVFIGEGQYESAVDCSLMINYAVIEIVNPAIVAKYPKETYRVEHTVGVDSSKLFVAKTGIRGSNDLVWIGRSANHAAKLTELTGAPIWITDDVHAKLPARLMLTGTGMPVWESMAWNKMKNRRVYYSNKHLRFE